MTLHRLPKASVNIYCTASRHHKKRRVAKWHKNNVFYCKYCAKKLWLSLRVLRTTPELSRKHYRRNEKTVTSRIIVLRANATEAELVFKKKLKQAISIKFKFQRGFVKGGYYAIVDFHIPSRNLCIEIDGGYHEDPEQCSKDAHRDKWLREIRGQRVIRITNEQALSMSVADIRELVASLRERQRYERDTDI